jgi:hypothetical protein
MTTMTDSRPSEKESQESLSVKFVIISIVSAHPIPPLEGPPRYGPPLFTSFHQK